MKSLGSNQPANSLLPVAEVLLVAEVAQVAALDIMSRSRLPAVEQLPQLDATHDQGPRGLRIVKSWLEIMHIYQKDNRVSGKKPELSFCFQNRNNAQAFGAHRGNSL